MELYRIHQIGKSAVINSLLLEDVSKTQKSYAVKLKRASVLDQSDAAKLNATRFAGPEMAPPCYRS